MRIEPLSQHPESVSLVAQWLFDEWGRRQAGVTLAAVLARLEAEVRRAGVGDGEPPQDQGEFGEVPQSLVAIEEGRVVGFASLKEHESRDVFPDYSPWVGSVFVAPEQRGRGIATALCLAIEQVARCRGVGQLYLQTEQHDGGLYTRLDYRPLGRVQHGGFDVVVMRKTLGRSAGSWPPE